ncbi:MAG: hypothetical protein WCJ30_17895, partial [Deltaproteobacteria bacterium]
MWRSRDSVRLARRSSVVAVVLTVSSAAATARAEERPFLFAQDAATTAPGHVDAQYRVTIGIMGAGAVRPIGAAGLGTPGSMHEVGAEVGLFSRLSLRLYGLGELGLRPGDAYATAGGELRVRVLGGATGPVQLTLGAGGFIIVRDPEEAALNLPRTYGTDDLPLVFTSRRFTTTGGVANQFQTATTAYGDYLLTNGVMNPSVTLPKQFVRL